MVVCPSTPKGMTTLKRGLQGVGFHVPLPVGLILQSFLAIITTTCISHMVSNIPACGPKNKLH